MRSGTSDGTEGEAPASLVTLRSWWSAGLEMTLAGVIVGGATYLVGLALPT